MVAVGEQFGQIVGAEASTPAWWMLAITLGLGVVLSLPSSRIPQANAVGLIAHEAGHAAMALLTGGRVLSIELEDTQSGETWSAHSNGLPAALVAWAGYASPPLLGLATASLIAAGRAPMVLLLGAVLALLVLVVSRGMMTFLLVSGFGAALIGLLWFPPAWVHTWVACALMALLLTHSAVRVPSLIAIRVHGNDPTGDDAEALREETGIPEFVSFTLWLGLIAWSWWTALHLLWPW